MSLISTRKSEPALGAAHASRPRSPSPFSRHGDAHCPEAVHSEDVIRSTSSSNRPGAITTPNLETVEPRHWPLAVLPCFALLRRLLLPCGLLRRRVRRVLSRDFMQWPINEIAAFCPQKGGEAREWVGLAHGFGSLLGTNDNDHARRTLPADWLARQFPRSLGN